MKSFSKIILSLSLLFVTNSFALEKKLQAEISLIIKTFKKQDKKAISALISYPLAREYPIPAINNKAELMLRFNEVFDEKLIGLITKSDLEKDWSLVGWRGMMFSDGKIWLDSKGKIKVVNYQSSKEINILKSIIDKQKQNLHK